MANKHMIGLTTSLIIRVLVYEYRFDTCVVS
jgi:hypothetical protein